MPLKSTCEPCSVCWWMHMKARRAALNMQILGFSDMWKAFLKKQISESIESHAGRWIYSHISTFARHLWVRSKPESFSQKAWGVILFRSEAIAPSYSIFVLLCACGIFNKPSLPTHSLPETVAQKRENINQEKQLGSQPKSSWLQNMHFVNWALVPNPFWGRIHAFHWKRLNFSQSSLFGSISPLSSPPNQKNSKTEKKLLHMPPPLLHHQQSISEANAFQRDQQSAGGVLL